MCDRVRKYHSRYGCVAAIERRLNKESIHLDIVNIYLCVCVCVDIRRLQRHSNTFSFVNAKGNVGSTETEKSCDVPFLLLLVCSVKRVFFITVIYVCI